MADTPPPDRPALDVQLPPTPASLRHRLDALLDDFDPFAVEETGGSACRVYFFSARSRDEAARTIARAFGVDGAGATPIDIPDDGWAERSQANLRAVRIDRIVVAPPWDRPMHHDGLIVIEIEPSTGFGTGHHASTRLCLSLMQRRHEEITASRRVIDLGTGSGVLAIAALRLGACTVAGIERDPDALRSARQNLARNGIEEHPSPIRRGQPQDRSIELIQTDLSADSEGCPRIGDADVVLANLTGPFFAAHPQAVLQHVAPGGLLIVSGFTEDEATGVRAALGDALTLVACETEDHWAGFALRESGTAGRQ